MKKTMFACGGTGGHVYPAIALAESWEKAGFGTAVFAGREEGMERRLVGDRWPFVPVLAWPLKRGSLAANLLLPVRLVRSLFSALKAVRRERPDVVVATGGYVSLPVAAAARILGIPVYLQEQNAVAGVANRVSSRFARKVFLADESAAKALKCPHELSGNPVRPLPVGEKLPVPAEFEGAAERILVMGGSQGAKGLNDRLLGCAEKIGARPGLSMVWQTGPAQFDEVSAATKGFANVHPTAFVSQVYPYMQNATLVVCRAGASTLAEITAFGKPTVLVPFPFATANHQEHNARTLERAGAALVELESEPDDLWNKISSLLDDPARLESMGKAALELGHPDSAMEIAKRIHAEVER
ncbi:MAG: undecaprenyldiphospho-muramoylpentapeptide beta-N-acetylglucosaminyltransferase [Fibrobacterales bacterium]|nr:undecaprenyldiphospho-muramoylpentapeptide beta-N-acetylglucosaminyltransferase [Fibrobacterales bacterium]MBP5188717.1 undecaprenyldiphospho-muramoylpentapeptide beta-N-acetylglucosaminyltransferase [Fibrobacterales bacterium]MBP5351008.1 undecaprenyldiphospho-muramoylpentapeptide beta-N-acetylglucosaminyltransferase [Fibrobacterales bacterium]